MKDNNIYNIFDEDKNEKETEETDNSNNIEQNFLGKKTNYRKDNIRSKIINHYCNFIINFLNDYVKKIFGFQKILFIKINYESKKNVNVTSIKNLMNLTIHQFCCLPISSKNPIFPQNHNINNLVKTRLQPVKRIYNRLSNASRILGTTTHWHARKKPSKNQSSKIWWPNETLCNTVRQKLTRYRWAQNRL